MLRPDQKNIAEAQVPSRMVNLIESTFVSTYVNSWLTPNSFEVNTADYGVWTDPNEYNFSLFLAQDWIVDAQNWTKKGLERIRNIHINSWAYGCTMMEPSLFQNWQCY